MVHLLEDIALLRNQTKWKTDYGKGLIQLTGYVRHRKTLCQSYFKSDCFFFSFDANFCLVSHLNTRCWSWHNQYGCSIIFLFFSKKISRIHRKIISTCCAPPFSMITRWWLQLRSLKEGNSHIYILFPFFLFSWVWKTGVLHNKRKKILKWKDTKKKRIKGERKF